MKLLQLFVNGLEVDLPTGLTIPISYSVNEIGNISTREAALSTTLNIPFTHRNSLIFAGNTYKVLPCEVRELGCLITKGTVEVESITSTFNIRIEAGNASFYKKLDGLKMTALNFYSQYNHIYSIESVQNSQSHSWTNVYTYPLTNPGTVRERDIEAGVSLIEMYPVLFAKRLFIDLISSLGYYVTGEFLDDALFSSALVDSGKPLRYSSDQLDLFKVKAGITPSETIVCNDESDPKTGYIPFNNISETFGYDFSDAGDNFDSVTYTYTVPVDMLWKATVEIPFRSRINLIGEVLIEVQLELNGEVVEKLGSYYTGTAFGGIGERRNRIKIAEFLPRLYKAGDQIKFKYLVKKSVSATDYYVELYWGNESTLLIEAEPYIIPGATIDVNTLLPEMDAKDFLLALANMFCLLYIVDENKREVRVEKFQKVVSNIPKAVNWSDKVDFTEEPEETFDTENYGQKSIFSYGETDDYTGSGYLTLLNEKLDVEKDVFESKFYASPSVKSFTNDSELLSIQKYDVDDNVRFGPWSEITSYQNDPGLDYVVYKSRYFKSKGNNNLGNTPLVDSFIPGFFVVSGKWEEVSLVDLLQVLEDNTAGIRIFHLQAGDPITVTWNTATTEVNQYASFKLLNFEALLNTYYAGLGTALYAAKYLKLLIKLKPSDVKNIDWTKPVFIKSFHVRYGVVVSGYWYISAVEQYKHGAFESCYVDLLRVVPTWQNERRKAAIENEYKVLATEKLIPIKTSSDNLILIR